MQLRITIFSLQCVSKNEKFFNFFYKFQKLLLREKQWCSWKADGFPDLFNNSNIQSSSSCDDIKFERKQISTSYVANSIDLGNSGFLI